MIGNVRRAFAAAAVAAMASFGVAMSPGLPGAEAATCNLDATAGTVTRAIGQRTYRLRVPAGLEGPSASLMVALHGALSTGGVHEATSGWSAFADSAGFIVAYPDAAPLGLPLLGLWNHAAGSPDVDFVRDVVDDIADEWCVDPERTYVEGHSRGAAMAHRLACDAGDRFAAAVGFAGYDPGDPCDPIRPIGVAMFHGELDLVIAPSRGEAALDGWVARNGCGTTPVSVAVDDGTLLRYPDCEAGVATWWRTFAQAGHFWPGGALRDEVLAEMWSFLVAHTLPEVSGPA